MTDKDEHKKAVLHRLHRIEGQVRGIIRMVEEDKDCQDVLTQVAAARAAMDRVGIHIISHRLKQCIEEKPRESLEEAIGEAMEIFLRFSSTL